MSILLEISGAIQQGRVAVVKELTQRALEEGVQAKEILENGLLAGMSIIGEKFTNNEVFVPEVLVAAKAMNAGVALLKPHMTESDSRTDAVVVLGTVKGDLHDIGKNLAKLMMEGQGIRVIDLGVNVPVERFIAAAEEHGAKVIAMSALLTTTMGEMKSVVEALKCSELNGKVKTLIGGAPINQSFCDSIGADGYAADAATGAKLALAMCTGAA